MNSDDFCELILPFLKVETSIAEYDVLCKVNKLFNKELKTERDIKNIHMWFNNRAKRFLRRNADTYYRKSIIKVKNSINFTLVEKSVRNGYKVQVHKGIVSFNDNKTVSMCITSNINRDIENDTGEIFLRTYSCDINDDKAYSLGLTYMSRNDGYGALISHTYSNIKSLKMMKDILSKSDFHSYEDEEDEEESEDEDSEKDEIVNFV